jgi:hypothetical protein
MPAASRDVADSDPLNQRKMMVEAAGGKPDISVDNTQLTDSENASNSENATISKSAVQSLYKVC